MKKVFFLFYLLTASLFAVAQSETLEVYILDASGTPTNVRNAPKGKVVDQVPVEGEWVFYVGNPRNGWWKIVDDAYYDYYLTDYVQFNLDEDGNVSYYLD